MLNPDLLLLYIYYKVHQIMKNFLITSFICSSSSPSTFANICSFIVLMSPGDGPDGGISMAVEGLAPLLVASDLVFFASRSCGGVEVDGTGAICLVLLTMLEID